MNKLIDERFMDLVEIYNAIGSSDQWMLLKGYANMKMVLKTMPDCVPELDFFPRFHQNRLDFFESHKIAPEITKLIALIKDLEVIEIFMRLINHYTSAQRYILLLFLTVATQEEIRQIWEYNSEGIIQKFHDINYYLKDRCNRHLFFKTRGLDCDLRNIGKRCEKS